MNASSGTTFCASCGSPVDESLDPPGERKPCTKCGSTARHIAAEIHESVNAPDGLHVKAKRAGEKKPFVEDMGIPSYSVALNKLVHRERLIDRDNDVYKERVIEYESGQVIHEDQSKLSEHIGHGSAKVKKPKPKRKP
jgi:hypothetical protein